MLMPRTVNISNVNFTLKKILHAVLNPGSKIVAWLFRLAYVMLYQASWIAMVSKSNLEYVAMGLGRSGG